MAGIFRGQGSSIARALAEQRRREEFGKPVDIGSDVWVGGGAIILPGVRIGHRSVIGAGSVVTRDIPERVFAAGNPCRVVRDRIDDQGIQTG
jgi:maltose O-acetyltransferase